MQQPPPQGYQQPAYPQPQVQPPGAGQQLEPAPRSVPLSASLTVVFGGQTLIGWLIFGFGMIFGWLFGLNNEAVTNVEFMGDKAQTQATVSKISDSGYSENETTLMEIEYRYQVDGKQYQGSSYAFDAPFDPGNQVKVEYLKDSPGKSRILGMRVRPFSGFTIFALIFPLVGFAIAGRGFFSGLNKRKLLKIGELGHAKLIGQEPTNTKVNDQTVYKLIFEFAPQSNAPPGVGYRSPSGQAAEPVRFHHKTHNTSALMDDPFEAVLYNPKQPSQVYLVDALPGGTGIENGKIKGSSAGFMYVLAPIIFTLVHGLWALVTVVDLLG